MGLVPKILLVSIVALLVASATVESYFIWSLRNQLKEAREGSESFANQLVEANKKSTSLADQLRETEKSSVYFSNQLNETLRKLESVQKLQKLAGYSRNEISVPVDGCNFPEGSETKSFSATIRAQDINKMESLIFKVIEKYGGTTSVYTFPTTPNVPTRSKTINAFYLPINQADSFIKDIRGVVLPSDIFIREDVYGEDPAVFKRNCQFFLDSLKRFRGEETTYLDQLKNLEDPIAPKLIKEKIDQLRGRSNEYNSQLEFISRIRDKLQVFITIEAFSS